MSDRVQIAAEVRSVTGKKVKRLRHDGWTPGVIYGQGVEAVPIQIETKPLRRTLRVAGSSDLFDIAVKGETHTVLIRDIQKHITRGDLLHVDFLAVNMNQTVTTDAALVTVGEAPVIDLGLGSIRQMLHAVDIECLPNALVSEIEVDLSSLEKVSDQIFVSDITPPEGVTILTDPDTLVIRYQLDRSSEEVDEEEEFISTSVESVELVSRSKQDEDFDD